MEGHRVARTEGTGMKGDVPSQRKGTLLTHAESLKVKSGSATVIYSFLVHTATTSIPSAVKKASKPVPLAVKKLQGGVTRRREDRDFGVRSWPEALEARGRKWKGTAVGGV